MNRLLKTLLVKSTTQIVESKKLAKSEEITSSLLAIYLSAYPLLG